MRLDTVCLCSAVVCGCVRCDDQALYDTSTPPTSSSPAHDAERTGQNTGTERTRKNTGPGGTETVAGSQLAGTDDIEHRHDENIAERDETPINMASR